MDTFENAKVVSVLLDKKTGGYDANFDDFIAPSEITVTITLKEYRSLVSDFATRKQAIDAAEKDRYSREQKIKELTEANDKLKGENYDLKTQIDALKERVAELSGKGALDA